MSDAKPDQRFVGNASELAPRHRGWILGHFIESGHPLSQDGIEVKWGEFQAGDERADWTTDERPSLVILVSGTFELIFPDREVRLTRSGDLVYWPPPDRHTWRSPDASVVITVRWPSRVVVPGQSSYPGSQEDLQ